MGRKRIHHTPEEKRLAACRNSKKYYFKNKDDIRERRKEMRKLSEESTEPQVIPVQEPSKRVDKDVAFWVRKAERAGTHFESIFEGKATREVCDHLCTTIFEAPHTLPTVLEKLTRYIDLMDGYLDKIDRCHSCVQQLVGTGKDLESVATLRLPILNSKQLIEDLWCCVLVEQESPTLQEIYNNKRLMFQHS